MSRPDGTQFTFGHFLRLLRQECNLTLEQVELCHLPPLPGESKVTAEWLARLEANETLFDLSRGLYLGRLYGVSLQALVEAYDLEPLRFLMPASDDFETVYREGERLFKAGKCAEAFACYWKAEVLAGDEDGRLKARLSKANAALLLRRPSLARSLWEQVLKRPECSSQLQSLTHFNIVSVVVRFGDLELAVSHASRGLALADPADCRSHVIFHNALGVLHLHKYESNRKTNAEALQAALRHFKRGLTYARQFPLSGSAGGKGQAGRSRKARGPCEFEDPYSPLLLAGIGRCLAWEGDYGKGRRQVEHALTILRNAHLTGSLVVDWVRSYARVLCESGKLALEDGDLPVAGERLRESLELAEKHDYGDLQFLMHYSLLRLSEAEGEKGMLEPSALRRRRRHHLLELAHLYPFKREQRVAEVIEYERRYQKEGEALLRKRIQKSAARSAAHGILYRTDGMKSRLEEAGRLAQGTLPVLLVGESGVGKELLARFVHSHSPRAAGPFVPLDCGAIPEGLLESELFGYVKGAFTGADQDKPGIFEAAHGGTLFLDEIGNAPAPLQVTLLRTLEEREVRRLGDTAERAVDVRLIAATNQHLEQAVREGQFRLDLYHRVAGAVLALPPLRERREDIPLLLDHFLRQAADRIGARRPTLSAAATELLMAAAWPGNVRELRNLCERLCALFPGKVITREELPSGDVSLPLDSTGVDPLYTQLVRNGVSFWKVVAEPFLRRELNRAQVRAVIARGLQATQGRYTELVRLFGLPDDQYHRFYKFLSKHHCRVDFRPYRQPLKK